MISILLKEHHTQVLEISDLIYKDLDQKAFYNWPRETFIEELQISHGLIFEQNASILGFILYRHNIELFEIMVLGVSHQSRKLGLMTQLLSELQKTAVQQGKAILLEVHEQNQPARALYLKMNFKQVGLRKNYYKDGGSAVIFRWDNEAS